MFFINATEFQKFVFATFVSFSKIFAKIALQHLVDFSNYLQHLCSTHRDFAVPRKIDNVGTTKKLFPATMIVKKVFFYFTKKNLKIIKKNISKIFKKPKKTPTFET